MEILTRWLSDLKPGAPGSHGSLSIVPLLGPARAAMEYMTLDEALAAGTARVTEVSEMGSVPELRFVNRADRPVLLVDGQELTGAKQNRILNLTILAPANKELIIPVSCVEAGRWAGAGDFTSASHVMYSTGRAEKAMHVSRSIATAGVRRSDQRAVWDSVAALSSREGVFSRTSRLDDVYLARGERIEEYVGRFSAVDGQVGAVFALAGRIRGIETFDHPDTLRKMLPKLVRSWAMDALAIPAGAEPPRASQVGEKLAELAALGTTEQQAVGLGSEVRFGSDRVAGGALVHDGSVVHLCAFWLDGAPADGPGRRMVSASRRARGGFGRAS